MPNIKSKRYGRIPAAMEASGLSRGTLYDLARKHPGLFKKYGAATLVDFSRMYEILDALPEAALTSPDAA